MPAWCSSPDTKAAKGEIDNESKKRGWDQLSNASTKIQLSNEEAERHKFIPYLAHQYPAAQKGTKAWLAFIKKTTGQAKDWKSVSTAYTQAANQTHKLANNLAVSDARRKKKDGAGLSQDVRKARGLKLTPEEEKLLARQVNMLCVCTQMMLLVYAWVQVLMTIFTCCAEILRLVPLGTKKRMALG